MPIEEGFNPIGGALDRRGRTMASVELDRGGMEEEDR